MPWHSIGRRRAVNALGKPAERSITEPTAVRYTIGVGIGGTFTDVIVLGTEGLAQIQEVDDAISDELIERLRREVPYEPD